MRGPVQNRPQLCQIKSVRANSFLYMYVKIAIVSYSTWKIDYKKQKKKVSTLWLKFGIHNKQLKKSEKLPF